MGNLENPQEGQKGNEPENLVRPEPMIIDGQEMLLTPAEVEMIKKMRAENPEAWREQQ